MTCLAIACLEQFWAFAWPPTAFFWKLTSQWFESLALQGFIQSLVVAEGRPQSIEYLNIWDDLASRLLELFKQDLSRSDNNLTVTTFWGVDTFPLFLHFHFQCVQFSAKMWMNEWIGMLCCHDCCQESRSSTDESWSCTFHESRDQICPMNELLSLFITTFGKLWAAQLVRGNPELPVH